MSEMPRKRDWIRYIPGLMTQGTGVSMQRVANLTAEAMGVDARVMTDPRRGKSERSWARQVAIAMCRRATTASLTQIGRHFGGRDHSTVLNAIAKVEQAEADNPDFRTAMVALEARVRMAPWL